MLKVTQEKRTCWSSRRLTRSSGIDNRQGHELKGEEAQLECSAEYADGVTSDVTLEEMYGTKVFSCAKVKTVMRNAIRESEDNDIPTDTAKVKLSVESATEGASCRIHPEGLGVYGWQW